MENSGAGKKESKVKLGLLVESSGVKVEVEVTAGIEVEVGADFAGVAVERWNPN